MFKSFAYSKILLVSIFLTFLAIEAQQFLPQRVLSLTPTPALDGSYFLMQPDWSRAQENVGWIDKAKGHFQCRFGNQDAQPVCNYVYLFKPGSAQGVNLQAYQRMELDLRYKGPAERLRVAIRNADPRFTRPNDANSNKFNAVQLRTSEFAQTVRVNLAEFKVADWWKHQYNLPREQEQPDLSNAVTFSLDIEGDLHNSSHDIVIQRIEFIGDWISAEQWYLAILLSWLGSAAVVILLRLVLLRRTGKRQRARINALAASNTELRSETDKFRKLSTVDALTNAFNRHGIEQIIESLDSRLESTAIILFDLDNFRNVNNERGHDVGDRVLQKVGEIIIGNTRNSDKFGRWGGEEFILICPNTPLTMAASLAEKLRTAIQDAEFEALQPLPVTASFGLTQILPDEPFAEAFKRADKALYLAKKQGRNQVVTG